MKIPPIPRNRPPRTTSLLRNPMCKFVKRVTVSTPTAEVSPLAERRETVMNPCDFLLLVFCLVDDELQALHLGRLRTRGPQPTLSDSEVLTMEIVGEFWGLDQD